MITIVIATATTIAVVAFLLLWSALAAGAQADRDDRR